MKKLLLYKLEILIFCIFLISRLPDLGHDNFNTDVWKWKQRSYDFGTGVYTLRFEKTFQKYHPGVTLMWVGSTGVKIANLITSELFPSSFDTELSRIFLLDKIQKILLVITIGVVLTSAFYVVRKILSTNFALLTFFLLIFEPFYVGLTRVFHLEGIMSTLMFSSVLWLYYYFQDTTKKPRFVVSAILGGLAILTKTSAIFLLPFVGFASIFHSGFIGYNEKLELSTFIKPIKIGLVWLALSALTFVLLWPVMWVNPVKALTGMYKGVTEIGIETDHSQIYFGNLVQDPGTLFYFVVYGLRTSVLLFIGSIIGTLLVILKSKNIVGKSFFIYILSYSLFYFIQITIPSKKLDRYLLPSIMSMTIIAGYFYYYLLEKYFKYKYLLLSLIILPTIITIGIIHYDYFSYYSPLFGGLKKGMYIIEPKWLIGEKEILSYFKTLKFTKNYIDAPDDKSFEELIYKKSEIDNMLTVGFQEKYFTQIHPFFLEMKSWSIIQELRPFARRTRYFVYPVWNDESKYEYRFKITEQGKIYIRGVHAYTVYEREY